MLAWTAAARLEESGLTATFCAGFVLARTRPQVARELFTFLEEEGQLLLLVSFAVAGALVVPNALQHATWRGALFAATSLTLLRIGPVWVALAGTGLRGGERAALGWMGPRGLPTLVLALLWRERAASALEREVLGALALLVLASLVLHGLTARATGRRLARGPAREEAERGVPV